MNYGMFIVIALIIIIGLVIYFKHKQMEKKIEETHGKINKVAKEMQERINKEIKEIRRKIR